MSYFSWWQHAANLASYEQQDAHEFFISILEGIHEKVDKDRRKPYSQGKFLLALQYSVCFQILFTQCTCAIYFYLFFPFSPICSYFLLFFFALVAVCKSKNRILFRFSFVAKYAIFLVGSSILMMPCSCQHLIICGIF